MHVIQKNIAYYIFKPQFLSLPFLIMLFIFSGYKKESLTDSQAISSDLEDEKS